MLKSLNCSAPGARAITTLGYIGMLTTAVLCGCSSSHSSAGGGGIIATVAGDGKIGDSGNGGPAVAAQFKVPLCVAVDSSGNMYIGDSNTSSVRKVDGTSGIISIYAGTGTQSYRGDGGPASKATLNNPYACTLDADGNLYIADSGNNVIRKVTAATGIITTVAGNGYGAGDYSKQGFSGDGGPATKAELDAPSGIAVDAAGDIFISDTLNQRVREVKASTGIITTIAGTGTSGFSTVTGPGTQTEIYYPQNLLADGSGNLYIVEGNSVAKLDLGAGTLSIFAGSGNPGNDSVTGDGGPATSARFAGPGGIAMDSAGDVYVADSGNDKIRKINVSTGIITSVVGTKIGYSGDGGSPSKARLNNPEGIAFDSVGNLYIADSSNAVVREVTW